MDEKILDKVRKLLAMGHGTDNPHEAAAFIAQAQTLMRKHRIDDAALLVETDEKDEPIEDAHALNVSKQVIGWIGSLGHILAHANGCRTYWQRGWNRHTRKLQTALRVVGQKGNADATRYLFTYCRNEIERLAKVERELLRQTGEEVNRTYMRSFREGCVHAIHAAIRLEREALDAEMRKHAKLSGETALIRLDNALVRIRQQERDVERWMAENMSLRSASRSNGNMRPDGYAAGRLAGANIYPGRATGRIGAPAPRLRGGG